MICSLCGFAEGELETGLDAISRRLITQQPGRFAECWNFPRLRTDVFDLELTSAREWADANRSMNRAINA